MRITQHGMIQDVMKNLNRRVSSVYDVQQQMSTGIQVARPSDDPSGASEILDLKNTMSRQKQYERNANTALGFLNMTESTLNGIQDMLISTRADMVQGANGMLNEQNRHGLAVQMDQSLRQLVQFSNQRYHNRYLFGGGLGNQAPYVAVEGEDHWLEAVETSFSEPLKPLEQIVDDNRRMEVTIVGEDFTELGDGENLFNMLFEMRQALTYDDTKTLAEGLDRMDVAIDQILSLTSLVGIRTQTLYTKQDEYGSKEIILTERLSELQDVDMVEAITRFQEETNAYEVALKTAGSVIQPSLVNFINF